MLDPTDQLDQKLLAFADEMKAKFVKRRQRHPGKESVTHANFDWTKQPLDPIREHLRDEFQEWCDAIGDPVHEPKESVDVANLAFLDWAVHRELRKVSDASVR